MLNKIIRFSLNNRLTILVASVLLMLVGSYTPPIWRWTYSLT